jgi:hypothetical protein
VRSEEGEARDEQNQRVEVIIKEIGVRNKERRERERGARSKGEGE